MTLCPKLSVFSVKISTAVKRGPGVLWCMTFLLPPGGERFIYIVTKSTFNRSLHSRCLCDRNNHHYLFALILAFCFHLFKSSKSVIPKLKAAKLESTRD